MQDFERPVHQCFPDGPSELPRGNTKNPYVGPGILGCMQELESRVADASRVSQLLPIIYVARHGETAWTVTGQHTGLTDLPLTKAGERNARRLAERLKGLAFAKVFTSPLQRAVRTCELAGFGTIVEIVPDLVEWDYGDYEGLTGAEIRAKRPDWQLFRDGCPGGESPKQAAARADRVVRRVRAARGDVLLFSSGHFIRVLAARWIGIAPAPSARSLMLSTASLSALGYENDLSRPVIRLWNDTHHVTS
jgi:broad specificity phosphatase PhoE